MISQNMTNVLSISNAYYMYIIFLYRYINVIAIHAFPKMYLNIKKSDFESKTENILAGFVSKYNRIYVS